METAGRSCSFLNRAAASCRGAAASCRGTPPAASARKLWQPEDKTSCEVRVGASQLEAFCRPDSFCLVLQQSHVLQQKASRTQKAEMRGV